MRRRVIYVHTLPYVSKNEDGTLTTLKVRPMFDRELETWICNQIGGGHPVYAERIRRLHRRDILSIRDYMMSILAGRSASSSQEMRDTLASAIQDLELSVRELRVIDTQKLIEVNRSFPYTKSR